MQAIGTADLLSTVSTIKGFVWNGLTAGRPYESGRSTMQQQDANNRIRVVSQNRMVQYYVTDRLDLFSTLIPALSTGREVIDDFRQGTSHYIGLANSNCYMSTTEALRIGTDIVRKHVPAVSQAAAALRALHSRVQRDYDPIAQKAAEQNLLATDAERYADLLIALSNAKADVTRFGGQHPERQRGETEDAFNNRHEQLVAAQLHQQTAQQQVDNVHLEHQLRSFPIVSGREVSPSDALIVFFWIVMDVLFTLGDQDGPDGPDRCH